MKKPKVATFAELIKWIAQHHHGGSVLPIAGRVGVSPGLVGFWARGETKTPQVENLQRLAAAYDLDFMWLLALVHGKKLAPISGGSDGPQPLGVVQVLDNIVSYKTLARWLRRVLAPALPSPCLA